jgi:glycosyltransferase involved in cell wall biosynthesis
MLRRVTAIPERILMTVDAVGGVWQYAVALARHLSLSGATVIFVGVGPEPDTQQKIDAKFVAKIVWLKIPPEWMAKTEAELNDLPNEIATLVRAFAIDLVHLNEPGQAVGLSLPCPVLAVSHSCIGTWFRGVRNTTPPDDWAWHLERTRAGLGQADLVVAPSASHAAALADCYGTSTRQVVVHNAVEPTAHAGPRDDIVFAAGRWWDEGKNGLVLDHAAALTQWPIFAAGPTQGPSGGSLAFECVIGLGSLPHAETHLLAGRSGIFVSPSLYEPFGLAALEAATAGTPLVLADIPTYRELWSDAAFFFAPRDPGALARTINQLIEDAHLRRALGEAAFRRSRAYGLARQAAAMRAAYEEAGSIHAGRC